MGVKKGTVAIVGGGAAGMMVGAILLERDDRDAEVILFEKNKKLGAKVIISGGGRCNLTTGFVKRKDLEKAYTRGWSFLETILKKFSPRGVRNRFESHGVKCKEEEDKRIFPVSNDGKEVVRVFEYLFEKDKRMTIHYQEGVTDISKINGGFLLQTNLGSYEVQKVVLTTGGNAFAHTGSSGDGYGFARGLGHCITDLGPSLNSFATEETRIYTLSGLSFPDASVHFQIQEKKIKKSGPILITHFGLSGPLTFIVASYSAFEEISKESKFEIRFQPIADMNVDAWGEFLLSASQTSKKELQTILAMKLPRRFAEALVEKLGLTQLPISQLSKKDRQSISDWLGNGIPLSLIKRRPGDEFVTAGGVDTDELDPKTLESKICPGLYFAGEILNIDGVTGGYNLQMCRSTGKAVGDGL